MNPEACAAALAAAPQRVRGERKEHGTVTCVEADSGGLRRLVHVWRAGSEVE